MGRRISELGLTIRGTRVEKLVEQLDRELTERGIAFRPQVYLSDQWGCPNGSPLIGIPFYLADARLARIEEEMSGGIEDDAEAMRYLRHEFGHAVNYAFRLYEHPEWRSIFGPFSGRYPERYHADPFSRAHVRHILGWYAQKHPDEDFAETVAVWLTPGLDWRREYAGWPALAKLEYVDRVLSEIAPMTPVAATPSPDDLPVEAMHYTVAEHYDGAARESPIADPRQFDVDLLRIFHTPSDAPSGELAKRFIHRHQRELLGRIAYWTGEAPSIVRALLDHLAVRAEQLDLRAGGLEAATLVELTAFGTAVVMNYRHARELESLPRSSRGDEEAA